MLKSIVLASTISLALMGGAMAQQPAPAQAAPQAAPAPAPTIKVVNIVKETDLPTDTQKQVDIFVKQHSDADLQQLRASVQANPQANSALNAKGIKVAEIIAATLSQDGTLTLITGSAKH